jgi:isocitrate/isopropylmalate dehydrogenase
VMMLHHLGETEAAHRIEKALLTVFAIGEIKTGDLGGSATTAEFTNALCKAIASS